MLHRDAQDRCRIGVGYAQSAASYNARRLPNLISQTEPLLSQVCERVVLSVGPESAAQEVSSMCNRPCMRMGDVACRVRIDVKEVRYVSVHVREVLCGRGAAREFEFAQQTPCVGS